jgi:hypothetical protein
MKDSMLTLGDVLPTDLKSKYADVLNVSMEEAIQIAKYLMPPTCDLSKQQVAEINAIYQTYLSKQGDNSDSAYWNKSATDNSAYWSKS